MAKRTEELKQAISVEEAEYLFQRVRLPFQFDRLDPDPSLQLFELVGADDEYFEAFEAVSKVVCLPPIFYRR